MTIFKSKTKETNLSERAPIWWPCF